MSYPNDSVAIVRAVNEIGVGDSVKIFGGGMVGLQFTPIMESLGSLAERHRQLQLLRAGHQVPRHRGLPRALREAGGRGEGRPARLLPAAVQLRDRPDARAGDHRHQEPRPQGARRLPAQERDEDHRRPDPLRPGRRVGERRAWCRRSSAASSTRTWSSSASPASRWCSIRTQYKTGDVDRAVREGARRSRRARAKPTRRGDPAPFFWEACLFSFDLLLEAILFGILLGCFYAAVSIGLSVSFGLLDVPHVAHPAVMVLGSYCTYVLGALRARPDPRRARADAAVLPARHG